MQKKLQKSLSIIKISSLPFITAYDFLAINWLILRPTLRPCFIVFIRSNQIAQLGQVSIVVFRSRWVSGTAYDLDTAGLCQFHNQKIQLNQHWHWLATTLQVLNLDNELNRKLAFAGTLWPMTCCLDWNAKES